MQSECKVAYCCALLLSFDLFSHRLPRACEQTFEFHQPTTYLNKNLAVANTSSVSGSGKTEASLR